MGVYIRGMEMPKGCAFCRIGKRNGKKMVCPLCDEEWDIHDPMSADHRLDNCPRRPVPPHGRLIDADSKTFPTLHRNPSNDYMKGWNACLRSVQQQPTVIEAEEGE